MYDTEIQTTTLLNNSRSIPQKHYFEKEFDRKDVDRVNQILKTKILSYVWFLFKKHNIHEMEWGYAGKLMRFLAFDELSKNRDIKGSILTENVINKAGLHYDSFLDYVSDKDKWRDKKPKKYKNPVRIVDPNTYQGNI